MDSIISTGLIGLSLGTQYALICIGFTLIFGILGVINFAHGGFYILGGYFAWFEEQLIGPVADHVVERRLDATAEVCRVVGSTLGLTCAARGGAHYSLDAVFQDPSIVRLDN